MKVIMKKTMLGSPNGFSVEKYFEGEIYDINEALYKGFKDAKAIKDYVTLDEVKRIREEKKQETKSVVIELEENKEIKPIELKEIEIKMEDEPENKMIKLKKKNNKRGKK